MMTLEEAIKHAEYIVNNRKDAISVCWSVRECKQLAAWLRELVERRKAPEIVHCGECAHQYKPTCPFGVWINTPNDGHCHWAKRRTDK